MRLPFVIFLACISCTAFAIDEYPELKTNKGKSYVKVTVTKVTESELRIMHSDGFASVLLKDLSPDLQSKYGYNPAKAEEEATRLKAEREQARREVAVARREMDEADAVRINDKNITQAVSNSREPVRLRVSQCSEAGALCYSRDLVGLPTPAITELGRVVVEANGFKFGPENREPIWVLGLGRLVDGDHWQGCLYPCGSHSYTTILGASKKVRKYATDAETAKRELMNHGDQ